MSRAQFHIYDHRLGHHEGRFVADCPSCSGVTVEPQAFTAAIPGVDHWGPEPNSPQIGDIWLETKTNRGSPYASRCWIWTSTDDAQMWVDVFDRDSIHPVMALPYYDDVTGLNPDVQICWRSQNIDRAMLARPPLGVDLLKEAAEQQIAMIEREIQSQGWIRVTPMRTLEETKADGRFIQITTKTHARSKPDLRWSPDQGLQVRLDDFTP